jgi:hypothetical protein
MTRNLLMTAAAAIVFVASIGIGNADADGGGFHGGFAHEGVIRDRGIHHEVMRHRFVGRRGFPAIGFGYDDLTSDPGQDATADAPPIVNGPQPVPAVLAGDRPPCHETTMGVIVDRGSSCSHGLQ